MGDIGGGLIATIHIDTSLQIERCKRPAKSKKVEKCLSGFPFKTTSTYAKIEFKRAWLQDLAYLYKASKVVKSIEDINGYVNDKLNATPFNRRRVSRCLEGINKYMGDVPGNVPKNAILSRFQSFLRIGIMGAYEWWDNSVQHEFNNIGCERASEKPELRPGGKLDVSIPQCRKGKANCRIIAFFQENRILFENIKTRIEQDGGASDELKRSSTIIEKALKTPSSLCEDVCAGIGDILIAIDGREMATFGANNDKEWLFLSRVLDKELINPVKSAEE